MLNLSESTLARNPQLSHPLSEHQNTDGTWRAGFEEAFQRAAQARLGEHGFYGRNESRIAEAEPSRGWWVHLTQCQHNSILLDLLILHHTKGHMEVELKTQEGRLNQNQRGLFRHGQKRHMYVCRTIAELDDALHSEGFLDTESDQRNYPRTTHMLIDELEAMYLDEDQTDAVRYDLFKVAEACGCVTEAMQSHFDGR